MNILRNEITLTPRERDVLNLICSGLSDSEIAQTLVLTVGTVKWYNRQIYNKLCVSSRSKAIAQAQRLGLLGTTPQPVKPASPPALMHNLPQYTTPFVGRRQELIEIARLLDDPNCRLLTLVGPGGSGKTRLALEAASRTHFKDGVYFVPLQPLQSADQMLDTIISVLHLRPDPATQPKQVLLDYLSGVNLLVILDNFEHLMDASDVVVDMLNAATQVKLIVTSREPLKVREEWVREVGGLKYPRNSSVAAPSEYSALQLFAERARRLKAKFSLDDEFEHVVRIAQMVDGLPLALELAAGWLRTLSCAAIVSELTENADILTSNTRDIPERHRSMQAVFDHSWQLLSIDERKAMQRLSVFRGGCTREAAEQVADASLRVLTALVEKSLVRYTPETDRYDMQELLRQYTDEKLKDNPAEKLETQENRHSAYYADYMGQRETLIKSRRQYQVTLEIEAEIDNVRTAWQWSVVRGVSTEIEQYLWCLFSFFWRQGRLQEGEITFEKAAQCLKAGSSADKANVLAQLTAYQAGCMVGLGYFEKGRNLLRESVEVLRGLAAGLELGNALLALGSTYRYLGVYDKAVQTFDEAVALFRDLGDAWWLGYVLYDQATLSRALGHFDEAERLLQESLDLFRPSGDPSKLADVLAELGQLMNARGNFQAAKRAYQESLEAAYQFPLSNNYAYTLSYLGVVCHKLGENEKALGYFHRALQTAKDGGIRRLQLDVLLAVAELLIARGDKEWAVELLVLSAHHPASYFETRGKAKQLLQDLAVELPDSVMQSAQEKIKITTLDQIIDTLYETHLFSGVNGQSERPRVRKRHNT